MSKMSDREYMDRCIKVIHLQERREVLVEKATFFTKKGLDTQCVWLMQLCVMKHEELMTIIEDISREVEMLLGMLATD